MINRTRILALAAIATAALLPAVAQAHWDHRCGCQRTALYRYHHAYYHHRYYLPRERESGAVELTQDVFAIPYHLRRFPYVSGGYRDRGMVSMGAPAVAESGAAAQSRVIDADAQVTILGPDRMNIRLFRKGRGVVIHSDH